MHTDALFQTIGRKSAKFLKENASTILSCVGTVGVVVTAVLTAKATPKAVEMIRADSRLNHDGDPYAYTMEEAVRSCWKCYLPAATAGASTIVCILSAHVLDRKQQAALVSSYGMIAKAYQQYQKKVKEKFGEEAHKDILRDIVIEESNGKAPFVPGVLAPSSNAFEGLDEEPILLHDTFADRDYFRATPSQVLQAEYHLNRKLALRGAASLNEFYSFLGIDPVIGGDSIGWYISDDFTWLDFEHTRVELDDGLVCYIISSEFSPGPEEDYGIE